MKVVIFGATGGTGRQLIDQALTEGHEVTAFARRPERIAVKHPRLRVVSGDVQKLADIEDALPGHDAVISALGRPIRKAGRIRSEGTQNILRAMETIGIRRLVSLSSLGFGDSRETLARTPFFFRRVIAPLLLQDTFDDHARQEEILKQSDLEWIAVRPDNLTNGPKTGVYKHGFASSDQSIDVAVGRADVAEFMLKQLVDNTYLRQTPGISY